MKKQSGFTLIELMVVMAIIAILATAGLSAYTGYIKKARDTTRIANIAAINTIALGAISVNGAPLDATALSAQINSANNGKPIADPLGVTPACDGAPCAGDGYYSYIICDSGTGFAVRTAFESSANTAKYDTDILAGGYYEVGSCNSETGGTWTNLSAS